MIKKIIFLTFIVFVFGCKSSEINKDLKGDWNVFNIFHEGEDILGNHGSRSAMTSLMRFVSSKYFYISSFDKETIHCQEITFINKDSLVLNNCSDKRIEEKFLINLRKEVSNNGKYEKCYLKLIADKTTIIAEKYTTDFSK
jgi:hypothetical protein